MASEKTQSLLVTGIIRLKVASDTQMPVLLRVIAVTTLLAAMALMSLALTRETMLFVLDGARTMFQPAAATT